MTDPTLPAMLGGAPAVTLDQTTALQWPRFEADDEAAVLEVVRDGDLSNHPVTRALEDDFRRRLGCRHALAHANGTLGLLAAFHALDLQPGDEILVPSATFWASVVPMLWVGAVPVFCEIEGKRFALDPADVERRITSRTRAMVIVHLWGIPAKVEALLDVARRHGLKVIEDASHALGATSGGVPCGRFGDISVFSLQTSKLAAAGEGGMFLTDDDACMERATCLGDIVRIYELATPARRFAATSFGIKTRMAPLSAAIGRTQLAKLDRHNAQRAANIETLGRRLQALGFDTLPAPPETTRVYFEHLVRYDPARFDSLPVDALIAALQAEGCEVSGPRYPLVHEQPFFTEGHWRRVARLAPGDHADYRLPDLPLSHAVQANMLRLPVFPWPAPDLVEQYATAFEKVHAAAARLPRPAHA